MTTYEVIHKGIRVSASRSSKSDTHATEDQEFIDVGETVEDPDGSLYQAFGDRLREVEEGNDDSSESTSDSEGLPDLSEMTNDEVEELVNTGEFDDELDALLEQEKNGSDRSGAKQAIKDRM